MIRCNPEQTFNFYPIPLTFISAMASWPSCRNESIPFPRSAYS